jgi:hypothetical protein
MWTSLELKALKMLDAFSSFITFSFSRFLVRESAVIGKDLFFMINQSKNSPANRGVNRAIAKFVAVARRIGTPVSKMEDRG